MTRVLKRLIYVVLLVSCNQVPDTLTPEKYVQYFSEKKSGYTFRHENEGIYFSIQWRPGAFQSLKQHAEEVIGMGGVQLDSMLNAEKGMCYVMVEIGSVDGKTDVLSVNLANKNDMYARIGYYNSGSMNDLVMYVNGEERRCRMNHFQRSYKMASFNTLLYGFDDLPELKEDLKIVFTDQVYGNGKIEFTIPKEKINKQPKLEI